MRRKLEYKGPRICSQTVKEKQPTIKIKRKGQKKKEQKRIRIENKKKE